MLRNQLSSSLRELPAARQRLSAAGREANNIRSGHGKLNTHCQQLVNNDILDEDEIAVLRHSASTLSRAPARELVLSKLVNAYLRRSGDRELAARLLSHLALIGLPVEEVVFHHCPEIAAECSDARKQAISEALAGLVSNRLVFPLDGSDGRPKFALHRQIRRLFLSEYTATSRTEGESSFFSTTLYAVEPRDNLHFDGRSYALVVGLVRALSNQTAIGDSRDRSACLRAAFGLATTVSSIGTLSRVGDAQHDLPRRGLFEGHAARLRDIFDGARQLTLAAEQGEDIRAVTPWRSTAHLLTPSATRAWRNNPCHYTPQAWVDTLANKLPPKTPRRRL